ncbi:MAG: Ku protein [Dehalococcoidia bacterium]
MPRPTWTGSVSFGLVTVPVKMYTAARSKDIRFNMLHKEDGGRVRQKRVCEEDGAELAQEDIVKGYEVDKGVYVMIEPEELEALEPTVSTGIEIKQFVDLEEIDPVYFENSYYLAPDKGAAKPYRLLLEAMRDSNKIAIATVVMRQKQYLTALRPAGNAISMATLYYPDEVVSQDELDGLPEDGLKFDEREVALARQLIDTYASDFDPEAYKDEYREAVLNLIEQKAAGETVVMPERAEAPAKVVDLMAALEASIAAAKGSKAPAGKAKDDEEEEKPARRRKSA